FPPPLGVPHRLPSMRRPVPQSKINCVPSGAVNSRHGVFPPYRQVAGSTVGVDPRTPQKLSFAMGAVMSLSAHPVRRPFPPPFLRKGKLVRCWQPRGNASMNSRRGRVKLPTKLEGVRGAPRARKMERMDRMDDHSHD